MDFRVVLQLITEEFSRQGIRYAVIGGFALGAWGVARTTIDLDFLLHRDDWEKVDALLKANGYECVHKSADVAQYVSGRHALREIDFLLAHRDISCEMLSRAKERKIFSQIVKVANPEDVVGLKIQALSNDASRAQKEYTDIESVLGLYKKDLDWQILKEYFELFGLEQKYREYYEKFAS